MTVEELQASFDEAMNNFLLISKLNNKQLSPSEDDYLNLNRAYFRICTEFYGSFLHLIGKGKPFPAIVILRSIIEIYTKAIYLDIIEKPKGTDVKPLISGEKDFPSFFKMTSALDKLGEEGKTAWKACLSSSLNRISLSMKNFLYLPMGAGSLLKPL
ncbi:hypothetical protein ACV1DG_23495 [Aeromonas hydrophila]|uniref:hypothetical protein n=1 Tax=Citrobacter freundii TaxID=546 RepID=UPI003A4CFACD|nr:hypothetical protein [Klebsiella pneumoniae]HCG2948103.1 hypothetical protein [Klebsiella pneumoniae]